VVLECHQERKKKANSESQTELARGKKIDIVWCAFERTKKIRTSFFSCHLSHTQGKKIKGFSKERFLRATIT